MIDRRQAKLYHRTKCLFSGRFISEDPVRDGSNWYAYAGGNPISRVDPMGLLIEDTYDAFRGAMLSGNANATGRLAIERDNIVGLESHSEVNGIVKDVTNPIMPVFRPFYSKETIHYMNNKFRTANQKAVVSLIHLMARKFKFGKAFSYFIGENGFINHRISGYSMPTDKGVFTSVFGLRDEPQPGAGFAHSGFDIGGLPIGEPVYSMSTGVVTQTGLSYKYGKFVVIGDLEGGHLGYFHLSAVTVKLKQIVAQDTQIGNLGNTGKYGGLPHLHVSFWPKGVKVPTFSGSEDESATLPGSMAINPIEDLKEIPPGFSLREGEVKQKNDGTFINIVDGEP